ncbi:uncharacterized protein METZ01_LOCUS75947 [marine metagenome]|jgi:hypothetical protein|uniref:Uncharacterized protein n=1 Tax=marine metagenome TaxID=408172 RepID=A0A381U939_9ZZZZ
MRRTLKYTQTKSTKGDKKGYLLKSSLCKK